MGRCLFLVALVLLVPDRASAASPVPAESRQMLLSVSAGWNETKATVSRYERTGTGWSRVGLPLAASLGQTGLAWGRGLHTGTFEGPMKKEGDDRSPAGVFRLREATGYAADHGRVYSPRRRCKGRFPSANLPRPSCWEVVQR